MKQKIETLILQAIERLKTEGHLDCAVVPKIVVERTRDPLHGDFASNVAMIVAKSAKMSPHALATKLLAVMPNDPLLLKTEIAGPGFINFFMDARAQFDVVSQILREGEAFGRSQRGAGKKIQVEFVSANPTGPLHVGHGRGAAYGSAVADLLAAVGFSVEREYYVNDAGRQMDILATSVWLRYLEICGESVVFPCNAYRGGYVRDIAQTLYERSANSYQLPIARIMQDIPADESQGGDKDSHIDALIERAKLLLDTHYQAVFQIGLEGILADIKQDLHEFGVDYQHWFSEQQLMDDGSIQQALERLDAAGFLYEQEGATWFASSRLGDEKDRVVVRDNGQSTYFASDIAYHMQKLSRGFDQIIDIWGADHHGYIPRVRAAMQALGANVDKLQVLLVQFAVLYRGEERVQMSTRSGEFVTLRELRAEVGNDAARFFYMMRRSDQHMDFDLQLATSKSNENPVFYVQYAYARICSVLRQLAEKNLPHDVALGMANLTLLTETHEGNLLTALSRYPEVLERAALQYEPHQLIQYLRELANDFHAYYNAQQFLVDAADVRSARLNLVCAVQQVLRNGLNLLKIKTPETM
jgi:arginyl-tRNA synthetase